VYVKREKAIEGFLSMIHEPQLKTEFGSVVKKSVSAIHFGGKLTLLQRKLFNALLAHAYDDLIENREHHLPIQLLCEVIGFDSNNIGYLRESLSGLIRTIVTFDLLGDDADLPWEAMPLLASVKCSDGMCTYRFPRVLAERLYQPNVYTSINLSILREINSTYTLQLYENCVRFAKDGKTPWWTIELFRELLGLEKQSSYRQFKVLNRAVIQPALKEVNALADIRLTLETQRTGRSITSLRFLVEPAPESADARSDREKSEKLRATYDDLAKEGVSPALARTWVAEYGETYISQKVKVARKTARPAPKAKPAPVIDMADVGIEPTSVPDIVARPENENDNRLVRASIKETEAAYQRETIHRIVWTFRRMPFLEQKMLLTEFEKLLGNPGLVYMFRHHGWSEPSLFEKVVAFWRRRVQYLPSIAEWSRRNGTQRLQELRVSMQNKTPALSDTMQSGATRQQDQSGET
jgi:hypothetical protein